MSTHPARVSKGRAGGGSTEKEVSMRRITLLLLVLTIGCVLPVAPQAGEPIKIGLTAAVSGGSAASGEAIKKGLQIAMDEINAKGLLGGRKLELVIRDDEGNPAKGVTIARELVEREKAVVIFGGLHTTVALAQVPVWHELRTPYMGVWAAGTEITRNGKSPNFVFRVSANDDYVDKFLVRYATDTLKKSKPGLLLENTAWGQSNEAGLNKYLGPKNIKPVGTEKFNWNDPDMSPQLLRLKNAGADHVILVGNAPEAAQVVKSRAKIGWEIPMVSHWGVSGGRFAELTGDLSDGVVFFQTYSFFGKQNEQGQAVLKALKDKYGVKGPEEVIAPVGVANAYDGLHLVALAIEQAGVTDGVKLRDALENLKGEHKGLIKTYKRPFTPDQHDALTDEDYVLVVWKGGQIVPVAMK
jgi:branched-chain amino acid transport system substrate-binding protein